MAEKRPGFITGANARIKAFNRTLAYCSDVSYNVTVQTIPVESMGKYEVHSNEPVAYSVDGTFSIIRYTKNAHDMGISDVADSNHNGPDNIQDSAKGNMNQHIDPASILGSQTFDLEIHEKRQATAGGSGAAGDIGETEVFRVVDCRLTRRGMTLNKRGVMVDNYAFVGILAQDSDVADASKVSNSGDEDLA
jgi:hypothetical protein